MKTRCALFVLVCFFCITAPAWSDTISQDARNLDARLQYSQPSRFGFSAPSLDYFSAFNFDKGSAAWDRNLFEGVTLGSLASFRFGEHQFVFDPFGKWEGGPVGPAGNPSNPQPSIPVPEPPAIVLLAAGLAALFGTALLRSPRGPRTA